MHAKSHSLPPPGDTSASKEENLFHWLPDPCVLIDPEAGHLLQANAQARTLLGTPKLSSPSISITRYFADQVPALIAFTQAVLDKGAYWTNDLTLCIQDKRTPLEIDAQILQSDDDNKILILMCLRCAETLSRRRTDADAAKFHRGGLLQWQRVEQVFQNIERQNQLILSAAGEGIYGVDANGRTTFLNPAAERMLGWEAQELIGKKMHETIHHSHRDGSQYPDKSCPIYAAFRDGAVQHVDDEEFWRRDGSSFPVEYTSTPIMDGGQLVGAVIVFSDISHRKQSEEKLRSALQEVEKLKHRLELENAYLQEEIRQESNYHEIVGSSAAIQHVIHKIEMVAPTDANVLVTGETGTGKELIARAIHQASHRHNRPLIRVNCAAIPRELFESEFFGHVRGAFTGATSSRAGRFELADGGTLFLDEVGEIPLELQGKLLRVLQDQQFERVGSSETRKVDVRVIAATNCDLKIDVKNKTFREDLYFRLNVFPIESVTLRERKEDIQQLAEHFLKRASQKFNKPNLKLTMADMEQLLHYHWPGNIRELENVIERHAIVAQGNKLALSLPHSSDSEMLSNREQPPRTVNPDVVFSDAERKQRDKEAIIQALNRCRGKVFGRGGAAELLGVKPTTLTSRIKTLKLERDAFK